MSLFLLYRNTPNARENTFYVFGQRGFLISQRLVEDSKRERERERERERGRPHRSITHLCLQVTSRARRIGVLFHCFARFHAVAKMADSVLIGIYLVGIEGGGTGFL